MKKNLLALPFLLVLTLMASLDVVASTGELRAYTFMNDDLSLKKREILKVCSDPSYVCIDLSCAYLNDEDLDTIFEGLVARERAVAGKSIPCNLKFLDIQSDDITQQGFLNFMVKLQKGEILENKRIIPDVRQTVVKVVFDLTEDYLDVLRRKCPSVLSGGLRIVD